MTAIKIIMSWLEGLAEPDWRMFHSDSEVQFIAKETLSLLKEQEAVVRCNECNNKECWGRAGDVVCGIDGAPHRPDWFCADGERKEGR